MAGFAVFGLLDPIAAALGTTPLVAAGLVGSFTLGILFIPTFFKIGAVGLAIWFVINLLAGSGLLGEVAEPEIDAKNAIIDVDHETIDSS